MKKIPVRQMRSFKQELVTTERFSIRRVEDIVGETNLVHDLHRHDFYFILAVKKGEGLHEIDFTAYEVRDHSVFVLHPGQVHQLELKAGCTGYLLEFNSEFYHPQGKSSSQRLRKVGNRNFCAVEESRFNKIQAVLASMFYEYNAREEGYQDVIKCDLDIMFVELARVTPHAAGKSNAAASYTQERFDEFLELLRRHIATHKQVSQYTEMMRLSPYQLNEITKSSVGKTASDLINEQVILEAKRYLLATSNQIKDIAEHLGYEDTSYFIRFFRKHIGQSPEAFRHNFG